MIEIRRYVTPADKDVIGEWLCGLKDVQARARIAIRIDRISLGNFGDCKPLRDGVSKLRIDCGPGYRVYYALLGTTLCCCFAVATSADSRPT